MHGEPRFVRAGDRGLVVRPSLQRREGVIEAVDGNGMMALDHSGRPIPKRELERILSGTTISEDPEYMDQMDRLTESLGGQRGPDQERIALVGLQWLDTLLRKNADYGSSAWKRPKLAPRLSVGDAILARMSDKVERIESLSGKAGEVAEQLDETLGDLGGYCVLYLARPK